MAYLRVVRGPNPGTEYRLDADQSVLGRHPDCDIQLEVAAVSRQHARISREQGEYYVEDLGSRNGTFVNDQEVQGRRALRPGDQISICDCDFTFDWGNRELGGPAPNAVLVEDSEQTIGTSTIVSTIDAQGAERGTFLSARPEVKLKALIEIGKSLSRTVSLDQVLQKLLGTLFNVFVQADRGFIVLQNVEDGPLIPVAVKHRYDDEETARISKTIVRQAMQTKEAILSADAKTDARFDMAQSITDFQIRSLMCAPLLGSGERALGVIQIDTVDRKKFGGDDLEVLVSVAALAAVAIENAQLHEQSLRQQTVERDLELAHRIQRGLLPAGPPSIPGYEFFDFYLAANQVGGDYYDYLLLPDGRFAVVLGDVAGKGVAAALMMAKLSGDVRFCLASDSDYARAVSRINGSMAGRGWEDRFVTFVATVVDPNTHSLSIVNAGHIPPLLRNARGEVEELGAEEAGLPLGVLPDAEYRVTRRSLEPGDVLTIFTDGISEAMNQRKELYGLERLRNRLSVTDPPSRLGDNLLSDVRRFVGNEPRSDDICLLCYGRNDS